MVCVIQGKSNRIMLLPILIMQLACAMASLLTIAALYRWVLGIYRPSVKWVVQVKGRVVPQDLPILIRIWYSLDLVEFPPHFTGALPSTRLILHQLRGSNFSGLTVVAFRPIPIKLFPILMFVVCGPSPIN